MYQSTLSHPLSLTLHLDACNYDSGSSGRKKGEETMKVEYQRCYRFLKNRLCVTKHLCGENLPILFS